jgi:glycosyltransferase involved in cell wall biosynthesis
MQKPIAPGEFLSICIPTRNRSSWLNRALTQLAAEIASGDIGPEVLKIYVSDNCSTDDTARMVEGFQARLPHLRYSCQTTNLGGDPNIIHCGRTGAGEYRWIMGDDDVICPGALSHILGCLRQHRPALFINGDGRYACGFATPAGFRSYREFAHASVRSNPHLLLAHSLITANIFRAECFDYDFALAQVQTSYGHMYGMVGAMKDDAGGVYVTEKHTISVRDSSLDPVDGVWPADMYKIWGDYLVWLKQQFDLPGLEREKIPDYIRRALLLQFYARPFSSIGRYAKNLNRGQTWASLFKLFKKS